MTREELYRMLEKGPLILDGATGSNLQKAGMPAGVCPELWILEHEEVLVELQRSFIRAGSHIVYAPTFSGNRIKLAEYGLDSRTREINQRLVAVSKRAAAGRCLVAGDLTMTGQALEPIGPMKLEDLIDVYREQAGYLLEAEVDLFVVETMMSLAETRACLIAIREICDLPIIASMTFQEDGRTLYGTDPVTAVVVLQSLGADVVGINCSTGPAEMLPLLQSIKEYAQVPLLVKPNAGLPLLVDGKTVYPMEAEEFASYGPDFVRAGAAFLGGCCGTGPDHIRLLADRVRGMEVVRPVNWHPSMISSERKSQEILFDGPFLVIGERINPTGKKKLAAELREGKLDLVEEMAESQEELGAHILDVNVGTDGINEKEMMLAAIRRLTMVTDLPLCIDSSSAEVVEAALRAYPGRALINSISLEEYKIREFLPLVKKYGAMFVLLPLSDEGLPATVEEKHAVISRILAEAEKLGIGKDRVIIDGLVTTAGVSRTAGLDVLATIRSCRREWRIPSLVGLSNISFGLPQRPVVNAAFLAMAMREGLNMAIANPSDALLMGIASASSMLLNEEEADRAYIDRMQKYPPLLAPGKGTGPDQARKPDPTMSADREAPVDQTFGGSAAHQLFQAVLKGKEKGILEAVDAVLQTGCPPGAIIDEILIPAINETGRLFDEQVYFLPQLIASANTMKEAIAYLEPMLEGDPRRQNMPVVVIATVEGDIHDIGKNLVALMLKNYGFQVIDLGKDVPAATIIRAARDHGAAVIVLSALMTTTMMRMKETVTLRNQEGMESRVIIGGAVTSPDFAREIGADGWSGDASEAVKLVQSLT